jgi:hypothetical protein
VYHLPLDEAGSFFDADAAPPQDAPYRQIRAAKMARQHRQDDAVGARLGNGNGPAVSADPETWV